jgi:hypothetical protein
MAWAWREGEGKEERGKRKEERGKRKEERGKRGLGCLAPWPFRVALQL